MSLVSGISIVAVFEGHALTHYFVFSIMTRPSRHSVQTSVFTELQVRQLASHNSQVSYCFTGNDGVGNVNVATVIIDGHS